ncbi:MAG: hypothetical protein AABW79_01520 [Nanoarchaeota archaeon]
MTETREVAKIDTFRDKYASAKEIEELMRGSDTRAEPEPDKRRANLLSLLNVGYNHGINVPGMIDPARHPRVSDLDLSDNDNPHVQLYRVAADSKRNTSDEDASKYFFANSGELIGQMNDESTGKIVDNPEMRKRLSGELQAWYAGYEQVNKSIMQAKGLEATVKSGGNVPKELREPFIAKVADENARKTIEHYKSKGFSEELQAEAGKIAKIAASIATYTPEDFVPAAEALVKDRENALEEFTRETMSPRNYVIAGLNELAGSEDGVTRALARDLVYAATD